jgi:hypothetical protein
MNKNMIFILIIILIAVLGLTLFFAPRKEHRADPNTSVSNEVDASLRNLVINFGKKLNQVSLLAPHEEVRTLMQTHYGEFLTPELLAEWQSDPSQAVGRTVSSPWPDRIEVVQVSEISKNTYTIEGTVIELVNSGPKTIDIAATYPVSITVEHRDGAWRISRLTKGAYSELPKRIVIRGIWECLPHRDTTGPQTEECALGVAADQSDAHYALNLMLMSTYPVDFPTGTRVQVEGVLTPANQLSTDQWRKYPIDGIINATSIQKI